MILISSPLESSSRTIHKSILLSTEHYEDTKAHASFSPFSHTPAVINDGFRTSFIRDADLSRSSFKADVGERETYGSKNQTVKPRGDYCSASEIAIFPKPDEQRVIKPLVVTEVV